MSSREFFFLPVGDGQRFCVFHPPQASVERGAVLYLHPFAEEMNKSRRMAALQSRALAADGYGVLQIDLLGCGDSSGDFADASWSAWRNDALLAYRWLRTQSQAPLTIWGLRAGCLLAASVAVDLPEQANFIFWQPVVSGEQHWQQFMRLKVAGELGAGKVKAVADELRQQLEAGQPVEIAGYSVSPRLVAGLEATELQPHARQPGKVNWFEMSMRDDATLAPVSKKFIEKWQAAGFNVEPMLVRGPGFWQTSEIDDAPELILATLAALKSVR